MDSCSLGSCWNPRRPSSVVFLFIHGSSTVSRTARGMPVEISSSLRTWLTALWMSSTSSSSWSPLSSFRQLLLAHTFWRTIEEADVGSARVSVLAVLPSHGPQVSSRVSDHRLYLTFPLPSRYARTSTPLREHGRAVSPKVRFERQA